MELATQLPRHRPVVEFERVSQAIEIALVDPEACVDFLAAIAARVPKRKQPFRANFRLAITNHAVAYGEVVVVDDDVGLAVAPIGVPGPHVLAAEGSLDARPP